MFQCASNSSAGTGQAIPRGRRTRRRLAEVAYRELTLWLRWEDSNSQTSNRSAYIAWRSAGAHWQAGRTARDC
jgi:hypothetical protein